MLTSFYSSGLRRGFANADELQGCYPVDLGVTHIFHLPQRYGLLKFRVAVTNVFDQSYQLRNGTGIGVFAPQFGPRRISISCHDQIITKSVPGNFWINSSWSARPNNRRVLLPGRPITT
jgi:hypothetical protein